MNTAARMEQSGIKNKIQLSQETADLLTAAGKGRWFIPRQNTVTPKGKGGK
jgi:class 3 adenylate cyclase